MAANEESESESTLSAAETCWLEAVRSAESLAELRAITGSDSEHDAYLQAKETWQKLRKKELGDPPRAEGLPGDAVVIDGQPFVVHGITHVGTEEERTFLREHVTEFLTRGESVYCEQGIRQMYFGDLSDVCEMDDYRWAMHRCKKMDIDSRIDGLIRTVFEDERLTIDIAAVASQFRDAAFSLIESGTEVYGERFAAALGDVVSNFLLRHEQVATMENFESFKHSRRAAKDPDRLVLLQHYYKTAFLPQPLEREWLRRHDRELELFTHARNERMAEYALYHGSDSRPVHLVVGAAHQPGVIYYLDAYRDGEWTVEQFELVP